MSQHSHRDDGGPCPQCIAACLPPEERSGRSQRHIQAEVLVQRARDIIFGGPGSNLGLGVLDAIAAFANAAYLSDGCVTPKPMAKWFVEHTPGAWQHFDRLPEAQQAAKLTSFEGALWLLPFCYLKLADNDVREYVELESVGRALCSALDRHKDEWSPQLQRLGLEWRVLKAAALHPRMMALGPLAVDAPNARARKLYAARTTALLKEFTKLAPDKAAAWFFSGRTAERGKSRGDQAAAVAMFRRGAQAAADSGDDLYGACNLWSLLHHLVTGSCGPVFSVAEADKLLEQVLAYEASLRQWGMLAWSLHATGRAEAMAASLEWHEPDGGKTASHANDPIKVESTPPSLQTAGAAGRTEAGPGSDGHPGIESAGGDAASTRRVFTQAELDDLIPGILCDGCGNASLSLKRCAGCKAVEYCSPECQKAHWRPVHKAECQRLKRERQRSLASASG